MRRRALPKRRCAAPPRPARPARTDRAFAALATWRVCLALAIIGAMTTAGAARAEPLSATLTGALRGTAVARRTIPDTGSIYVLSGSGRLNVGTVTVTGSLRGTGFIMRGTCSGTVLLRGRAGTLSLTLRSPTPVPGFSTCSAYDWQITGSSGSFAGQTGRGSLTATVAGGAFTLRFG